MSYHAGLWFKRVGEGQVFTRVITTNHSNVLSTIGNDVFHLLDIFNLYICLMASSLNEGHFKSLHAGLFSKVSIKLRCYCV